MPSSSSSVIKLRVTNIKATDLKNVEWVGKMDPYLKISLAAGSGGGEKKEERQQCHQTKHMDGAGRTVSWEKEMMEFEVGR